jgi:hypothetical protein
MGCLSEAQEHGPPLVNNKKYINTRPTRRLIKDELVVVAAGDVKFWWCCNLRNISGMKINVIYFNV